MGTTSGLTGFKNLTRRARARWEKDKKGLFLGDISLAPQFHQTRCLGLIVRDTPRGNSGGEQGLGGSIAGAPGPWGDGRSPPVGR